MDNDDKYCNVCSIINEHFMDEINMCITSVIRDSRAFATEKKTYLYEISNALRPKMSCYHRLIHQNWTMLTKMKFKISSGKWWIMLWKRGDWWLSGDVSLIRIYSSNNIAVLIVHVYQMKLNIIMLKAIALLWGHFGLLCQDMLSSQCLARLATLH